MQALLLCARGVRSPRALPDWLGSISLDWDLLLRLAETHGLTVLLHRQLASPAAIGIPSAFLQALDRSQRLQVQQGLRHTAVLAELARSFSRAGVGALAYKGPALSAQIFGDPATRPAADLDILISPADFSAARTVLSDLGFAPLRFYPASAARQLVAYRAEFGMVRNDLLVELQWRLVPHYFSVPLDIDALIARATSVSLGGVTVATMAAEDNLIALCIHGAKHHWQSLKWVLDIDLLVRDSGNIDWAGLQSRAAGLGTLRILRLGLFIAHQLLETPLPDAVLQGIERDPTLSGLTNVVICGLERRATGEMEHHRLMLALRERPEDRVRYLARLAYQPTEAEWDLVDLPRGFQSLYPVVRAWRVAGKSLRMLFS
ncbi:MAG TPA: nucleotidyltransferase family protein [Bryobacteraceae bacterium]|nr:nucleotidyltransferase family protein [Bryobacteraceae bacterium]